jgi:hypothetical protein
MTVRTSRLLLYFIYWLICSCATALFVNVPHPSISYIYQSIGCQHNLQHTDNDFKPPSIPALTTTGFVRWESIETLLGPEEHVPFLQTAVRNFGIKHPDTGEPFPIDLPKEAFPLKADPAIERWHNECAEKLRRKASPDEFDRPYVRPSLPPRHDIRSGYSHLRNPVSPGRVPRERQQGADYFSSRPRGHKHVSSGDANKPPTNRGSSYRPYLSPGDEAPQFSHLRRRSFPDNYYSPPATSPAPVSPQPPVARSPGEDHIRRHSHPRHRREPRTPSSSSESDTDPGTSDEAASPKTPSRQKPQTNPKRPTSTIHVSVPSPSSPVSGPYPTTPQQRKQNLAVPERLANYKIPVDSSGKLSAPFIQAGARYVPAPNPRVGAVRYGSTSERSEFPGRGSLNLASTVEDADDDDDDEEERRNRERERRRRGDGQPQLVKARSGSHDGRYITRESDRRGRDRDRERYSDRDEKDPDRRREKNRVASPSKGVDWRKYIPEMLR